MCEKYIRITPRLAAECDVHRFLFLQLNIFIVIQTMRKVIALLIADTHNMFYFRN